jgi:hypothetical protein
VIQTREDGTEEGQETPPADKKEQRKKEEQ